MLCHTKSSTAQINYVQPVEDSVRSAVDKLGRAVATTEQQPKSDAQDKQGEEQQRSAAEQKPDIAPLRYIVQLVNSVSSV
jgi:hypothetical protein